MKITKIEHQTATLGSLWESGTVAGTDPEWRDLGVDVETEVGSYTATKVYRTEGSFTCVSFDTGVQVRALENHRFKDTDGNWIFVRDIKSGDTIRSDLGSAVVTEVQHNHSSGYAFDLYVPGPHEYYANGLVSHNSMVLNNICLNQAKMGYKVLSVTLEMTVGELLARSIARVAHLDNTKVILRRLASGEREEANRKIKRMDRLIAKKGGRYTMFQPMQDMAIEEIMAAVHSFGADAVYIDYISLLKGADGDDQWRVLGQIARFGKVYAGNHNKVMGLLAQVNEDGRLRYSQAVKEHSSLAWTFNATKQSKELGYLNFEHLKARNQDGRPFTMKVDYATQAVSDFDKDELSSLMDKTGGKKTSKYKDLDGAPVKRGKSSDYMPDLE